MMPGESKTGTVKKFWVERGYGFIKPDDVQQDIFVLLSAIIGPEQSLQAGDRVTFVIGQGQKGPQAERVRRIGK